MPDPLDLLDNYFVPKAPELDDPLDVLDKFGPSQSRIQSFVRESAQKAASRPASPWQKEEADFLDTAKRKFPQVDPESLRPHFAEAAGFAAREQAMEQARGRAAGDESTPAFLARNVVPVVAQSLGFAESEQYREAKHRLATGQADRADYDLIAGREARSQAESQEGLGASLLRGVARVPTYVAPGGFLSWAFEGASKRADEQGGEWYDPKNIGPEMVKAAVTEKVLGRAGQIGAVSRAAGGGPLARAAVGAVQMPLEQQLADTGLSLVDEALPDAYQFKTKYGTLGSLVRGDNGSAKSLVVQALTGGLFKALHAPEKDRKQVFEDQVKDLGAHLDAAHEQGLPLEKALELWSDSPARAFPDVKVTGVHTNETQAIGTRTPFPVGGTQENPRAVADRVFAQAQSEGWNSAQYARALDESGIVSDGAGFRYRDKSPTSVRQLPYAPNAEPPLPQPPEGQIPAPESPAKPVSPPEPAQTPPQPTLEAPAASAQPEQVGAAPSTVEQPAAQESALVGPMTREQFTELVNKADLTAHQRAVLSARISGKTQAEIAESIGASRQAVHDAEKKAYAKMGMPEGWSIGKHLVGEESSVAQPREEFRPESYGDLKKSTIDHADELRLEADRREKLGHKEEARILREEADNHDQDLEAMHAALTEAKTAGRSDAEIQRSADAALAEAIKNASAPEAKPVSAVERPTPAQLRDRLRKPAIPSEAPVAPEAMPSVESRSGLIGGGQDGEGQPQRSQQLTALANEVVDRERAQQNLQPMMKAARQSNPETWDRAMAKLDANPEAGRALVDELAATPRATTAEENALLLHRRITLSNELRRVAIEGAEMFHPNNKDKFTNEQMADVERRYDDVMAQAEQLDKVTRATGTEWGRAGQFRRQLAAEDYSLASMLLGRRMAKGSDLTPQERQQVVDLSRRIEELQAKLEVADTQPDRIALKKARSEFAKIIESDKDKARPIVSRIFSRIGEALNVSRSIITSLDLSAVLRQGGFTAFSRPLTSLRAIPESIRAFASKGAAERAADNLSERPNSKAGLYDRAGLYLADTEGGLSKQEESFMSKWAGRIPLVAGSERAYTTFLNRIRADVFDSMIGSLGKNGRVTEGEAKAIANFVNVSTGRGGLGPLEKSAVPLAHLFFSPRYLASRFQLLAGQPIYGGSAGTRKAIAAEYGKALAGLGLFYGALKLAGGDDVDIEADPRSSDFGKVRIGKSRIDPLTGLSQTITAGSRLVTGETKNAEGVVVSTRGEFAGQTSPGDIIGRFVRGKLAPLPGAAVDVTLGKDAVGESVTPLSVAKNLAVPFSVRDVYESMTEQGVPKGSALSLLALLGMGTQSYGHESTAGTKALSEVRELKRRYLISHGRTDEAAPHQSSIADMTGAVRDNDQAAFNKAWAAYNTRLKAMGKDAEERQTAFATAAHHFDPLAGLSDADRHRFYRGLSDEQKAKVKAAQEYAKSMMKKLGEMKRQAR